MYVEMGRECGEKGEEDRGEEGGKSGMRGEVRYLALHLHATA